MEIEGYKDHNTRRLLFEYISDNPGSTFKVIRSAFKLTDSTLRYHLGYLQRRKKIVQEKKGREKCYYSYLKKRFPFSDPNLNLSGKQERLLQIISQNPDITYKELKTRSGMDRASFSYNLRKLKRMKLIWRVTKKGKTGYDIVTKEGLADEMFLILVRKYLDGDVDKDEMIDILDKLKDYRGE
jgi:predicted transcriptional regulator